MIEILLPRTDAGVALQLAVTVVAGTPAVVLLHRADRGDAAWFVSGLLVIWLAFMAFRSLH
jgi:hypothetical protein